MTQTIFSIDKLRTKIGGFAKGNRYNVTIIPPQFIIDEYDKQYNINETTSLLEN